MLKFFKLLICFWVLLFGHLFAAHGTVQGTVTDSATGLPISGAIVSFIDNEAFLKGLSQLISTVFTVILTTLIITL